MAGNLKLQVTPFKKDTYINVEGKLDANRFYIIKDGQVQISRISEVIEEDTGNILYPGDFFGVVSSMSVHPRIETAMALTDISVIAIRREQFGDLIQAGLFAQLFLGDLDQADVELGHGVGHRVGGQHSGTGRAAAVRGGYRTLGRHLELLTDAEGHVAVDVVERGNFVPAARVAQLLAGDQLAGVAGLA